jgi:multisubunit Na+/H+ antiporter MnhF subunit
VNAWLIAATVLLGGLVPCGIVLVRLGPMEALVALELAGSVTTLALLCLAEGFDRSSYFVVPLVLAVLSVVGNLVYVRFLPRIADASAKS